jgi:hypothetical protein
MKSFTKNGKTYTPKQDLADIQQWECDGSYFIIEKPATRKKVIENYDDILEAKWIKDEEKARYGELA